MLCLIPSATLVLTPVASWTCAGGAEGGQASAWQLVLLFPHGASLQRSQHRTDEVHRRGQGGPLADGTLGKTQRYL